MDQFFHLGANNSLYCLSHILPKSPTVPSKQAQQKNTAAENLICGIKTEPRTKLKPTLPLAALATGSFHRFAQ